MARMIIKSFPSTGFAGIFRAGRFWPASGVLVETTKEEADVDSTADHPLQICAATLKALRDDGRFSEQPEESADDVQAIRDENAALKVRVLELEAQIAEAGTKGGKGGKSKE